MAVGPSRGKGGKEKVSSPWPSPSMHPGDCVLQSCGTRGEGRGPEHPTVASWGPPRPLPQKALRGGLGDQRWCSRSTRRPPLLELVFPHLSYGPCFHLFLHFSLLSLAPCYSKRGLQTRSLLEMQNLGPAPALLDPNLRLNETSKGSVVGRCLKSTGLGLPVPPNPFLSFGPGPSLAAPMAEGGAPRI